MPAANADLEDIAEDPASRYTELPFPPLKESHILHCSVHYWYPKYRALTPKARLIPLSTGFIDYLRADGIVLPPDETAFPEIEWHSDGATHAQPSTSHNTDSDTDSDDNNPDIDPSTAFPSTHLAIKTAIAELGGKVAPKLNWSAPKDATWINPTNSMACTTANEVYLMLKSSDFVTHDLEHWCDGCVDVDVDVDVGTTAGEEELDERGDPPYHLLLRKHVQIAVSVEFRCFVRRRRLVGICQRDPNFYDFLDGMVPQLRLLIETFFEEKLRGNFPDESFAFDVYVPAPYQRVWLVDINPWCKRTDPLLFSWLELLTLRVPEAMPDGIGDAGLEDSGVPEGVVRLPLRMRSHGGHASIPADVESDEQNDISDLDAEDEADEELFVPEFRLIKRDDPEAYSFNSPQYSAHKLPADVVEASQSGPGPLREFAEQWKEVLAQEKERNGGR